MTWEVGDLALCINDLWIGYDHGHIPGGFPQKNVVYRVASLKHRDGVEFLRFADFDGKGWNEKAFRKIKPDEREACEPEFIQLLQRSKKREVA